jgi:calcineurin-like phosphoesterase family protein
MNFYTSDQHLMHRNIIKYCDRPFDSVEHMDSEILRRWNDKVSQEDTVYVVGDFALGTNAKAKEWLSKANGRKVLIIGNHDNHPNAMREMGFDEVHYELIVEVKDEKWLLSHYPKNDDLLEGVDRLIHGHKHSGDTHSGKCLNICVDLHNFEPISEDKIYELYPSHSRENPGHCSLSIADERIIINADLSFDEFEGFVQSAKIKMREISQKKYKNEK